MSRTPLSRRRLLELFGAAGASAVLARDAAAVPSVPPSPSRRPRRDASALSEALADLVAKHRMPGAVAAVYSKGKVESAGAGIANLNTGAPMTAGTGFLTGSITKVWCATLVMSFVDEGAIDLDLPVVRYLPRLRFADAEATRQITTRQLLNHSSGLDAGDFIMDLGEGPLAHTAFVEAMSGLGQIHRPGAYSSYCNGGWVLAGHLLETLSGKSWHQLLEERVIRPLGLERTFAYAEDGILFGSAVGGVPDPKRPGEHMATPKFLLPKTFAPAGATLITTVEDNLRFARLHMRGGTSLGGTRVVSEGSARAMATRTIDHPSGPASGFGLGWMLSTLDGRTMLSHGGGSNGGRAQLAAVPDADFAYATFVNSNVSGGFQAELQSWIASNYGFGQPESLGGRAMSAVANAPAIDRSRFVGTYRRTTTKVTIREEGEKLILTSEWILSEAPGTEAYVIGAPTVFEMVPVNDHALALASADPSGPRALWTFLEPDRTGRFGLMYANGRLARRID
ncbi:MAG: serine hydrolase domain-containing protein [Gemmatimonadales bacterium]